MVMVRAPLLALRAAVTESVELPDPVIDVGLKVPVTREPSPLTLRLTAPVNPFTALMVTVYCPVLPRVTLRLAGETAMVKSGTPPTGFTTRVTVLEWLRVPLVPEIVSV